MVDSLSIIGAGAWGTALAAVSARAGLETILWAREPEVIASLEKKNENTLFLPGVILPDTIVPTDKLEGVVFADALLLAVPAQYVRATCRRLAEILGSNHSKLVIIAAKGIENETHALMSEIVAEFMPSAPLAVVSGPTFAAEVAKGKTTAMSFACADALLGAVWVEALSAPNFRLLYTDDIIGAQIGGAVKNVLAIGCGVAAGLGGGDNTIAALITLGLKEMAILSTAKGGKPATLMELCGIGDLVLTCSSMQSRNMSLGYQLGQGKLLEQILAERLSVAEGVATARAVYAIAEKLGLELPLCRAVHRILYQNAAPQEVLSIIAN